MNITSTVSYKNLYAPTKGTSGTVKNPASTSFLDNIYTQPKSGSYSKESGDTENFGVYSKLQSMAVASPKTIAEQKEKFADMYVSSTARKYYDPSLNGVHNKIEPEWEAENSHKNTQLKIEAYWAGENEQQKLEDRAWNNGIKSGCMLVQLQAGELPKFMDYVGDSLKKGKSLEQTLQKYLEQQPKPLHCLSNSSEKHDWFLVDPENGDVTCAWKGGRVQHGSTDRELLIDREAVYELADDLNTFLRYAVFPQCDDDPEKVEELISYIKNKQAYANFDRFLDDDEKGASDTILQNLIDAGVLKDDEDEEEEEAVDGLMEAIRVHQEELKKKRIDIEEGKKAVAELREMLDSRVRA